jgi:hypothetical protein
MEKNGDGSETTGALTRRLHQAATDAGATGYPQMARLLDDCAFALASCAPSKKSAIEGRARKALTVWTALRSF